MYDTLHYDGDTLLFTTDSYGRLDDIKVGTLADITPLDSGFSGLSVWDRDASGEAIACHNATGAAGNGIDAPWKSYFGFSEPDDYTSPCSMQGRNAPSWQIAWTEYPTSPLWTQEGAATTLEAGAVGQGGLLGMPRTDGFTDGFTTFQGDRSYDSNLGNWVEPDPENGTTGVPSSQQSYEYNESNPLMHGDLKLARLHGCFSLGRRVHSVPESPAFVLNRE